jgi:hypothetical protein
MNKSDVGKCMAAEYLLTSDHQLSMKRLAGPWSTCHPKILVDCIKARKRQNLKKLAGEV